MRKAVYTRMGRASHMDYVKPNVAATYHVIDLYSQGEGFASCQPIDDGCAPNGDD